METILGSDDSEYFKDLVGEISKYKHTNLYCDFIIKVGSSKIPVHKVVLSAASDYFEAMFRTDARETQSGEADIKGFSEIAVKKVIEYIYTGKVCVDNKTDISELMQAAHMMELKKLCGHITKYLEDNLKPETYFVTKSLSKLYNLDHLEKKCDEIAFKNFAKIAEHEDFKKIDEKQLIGMIKAKENKESEEGKCFALINWTKFDVKKRSEVFINTFKSLDLARMSPSYRKHLLEEESLIATNAETLRIVALSFVGSKVPSKSFQEIKEQQDTENDNALVIFDDTSGHLQQFNPRKNEWKQMQSMTNIMQTKFFSAVSLNQYIYVLMEDNSFYRLNYDDKGATWETLESPIESHGRIPPMTLVKDSSSLSIWIVGGFYPSDTLMVEKYDSLENQWQRMTNKNVRCFGPAVACLQENIYSLGGREGSRTYINKAERFNLSSSTWSFISPMLNNRYTPTAVEFHGQLYVLGGTDDGTHLQTVETYNPSFNSWTMFTPMVTQRSVLRSFVMEGFMYAVGGYDSAYQSIEKYDSDNGSWKIIDIPKEMNICIKESVRLKAIE